MTASPHWAVRLECTRTGATAPLDRPTGLSPAGAPWRVAYELDRGRGRRLREALGARPWSLWRYRELLPVERFEERVDLGEGGTPLVRLRRGAPKGAELWLKEESGNPTGSFKARGLSLAVNRARELGLAGVELASAGNAALAVAAYAAAARLSCRVALPVDAPAPIREGCRAYGAEVLIAGANLVEAGAELARANDRLFDVSTLREPYRVEGKKTMGLELAERLGWRAPDWIVYPTGGGTGIVGMREAFRQLARLGLLEGPPPRFAAVQVAGCAPIVRAFERGEESAAPWENPRTRVWGLRVPKAIGDFLVLTALRENGGAAIAVEEEESEEEVGRAAREDGLRVGPEGGAALAGMRRLCERGTIGPGERVVVFQTGHPANYR